MLNKEFKIVLLENNPDDIQTICEEFKKTKINYTLDIINDKESYKRALLELQPDLILAESEMPDMEINEAMELCRELSPKSSIILLTLSLDRKTSIEQLIKNPQEYLDRQKQTKLNAAIKTSLDILNATEELNRMDSELKGREALLTATLESTADGILVVNNDGRIVSYNQNFLKMWRMPKEVMDSGDDSKALDFVYNQLKEPEAFMKRVQELYADKNSESYDMVYFKDNRVFERLSKPQKIEGESVGRVWSFRDITERVLKDEQINASLKEKELMLREIHHRVKNNLQIISSLLNLQSLNTKDPETAEHLRISMNRVRTMAMIHEKLYGSKELSHIEFAEYVKQLAIHIFISYGVKPNTIKINVKAKDVFLDIDTAVPCGLLVNEIISNSLKHAFPCREKGLIEVELYVDKDNFYNLFISDDGIGIPQNLNPDNHDSLGLRLINTLAKQLGSEMNVNCSNGTKYYFRFPPLMYMERK